MRAWCSVWTNEHEGVLRRAAVYYRRNRHSRRRHVGRAEALSLLRASARRRHKMPSETVQLVVRTIREQRERFEAFCRSLSEEELERPVPNSTWIVKDFLSHLGSLDPTMTQLFEATAAGHPEEATLTSDGSPFDIDALNDGLVAERRSWPLERILE